MNKVLTYIAIGSSICLFACNEQQKESARDFVDSVETKTERAFESADEGFDHIITVNLESKSNSNASGQAVFKEKNGIVHLEVDMIGLQPNQEHAIHLHENGDCSSDDGSSAGGHWNPTNHEHGKWNDNDGFHKGDIGNLKANDRGEATLTFKTDEWCISCDDVTKNIMNKSVIVHEKKDDFKTQPTGDAGGRIACGVIE